jgi:predicted component of type VI protein secretion system
MTETYEAWIDGAREDAVRFEVSPGEDVVAAGASALDVEVSESLNVARAVDGSTAELLEALQALIVEYEPNLKVFALNAPRKEKWEAAIAAAAKATGEALK